MEKSKYVAYVGTYTHGSSEGIHIYDMDIETGLMEERKVVPINNPSYLVQSLDGKFLYSISDEGLESFEVLKDGDLKFLNKAKIHGMRGCHLSIDSSGKYLFVAGYHDGKVTVMELKEDGKIGRICDGIFHKGLGTVAERNFRPHVSCVKPTPDGQYLCAVDNGIDHIKIYRILKETGRLELVDILRLELESAPRLLIFSNDGKFAYIICELSNEIQVYSYDGSQATPVFEYIQTVQTYMEHKATCAACGMKFSRDGEYLYCSSAGDNTASIFKIDKESGKLHIICSLPISGSYPKDIDVFPNNRYLIVLNHESSEIRTFAIDYEKEIFLHINEPKKIDTPNCILISEIK